MGWESEKCCIVGCGPCQWLVWVGLSQLQVCFTSWVVNDSSRVFSSCFRSLEILYDLEISRTRRDQDHAMVVQDGDVTAQERTASTPNIQNTS